MKKNKLKFLFTLGLLFVFLGAGALKVNAREIHPFEVEFRLYTDINDVDENIAKGGYISANTSFLVEEYQVWKGDYYVSNKLQKMGEEALRKKYGQNIYVADMILTNSQPEFLYPGGLTYIKTDRHSMIRNGANKKKLQIKFPYHTFFHNKIVVTLFGSVNGPLNGWKVYNGEARYYNNNVYHTGLKKVGQTTYLFSSTGAKQFGWHSVNDWQMYFNPDNGGLWTGKRKIGETTYLFNSQGHKIDGWHRLNGKDYFFNQTNGGMWTGKRKIGNTTYLLHNDGHKIYGWYVDNKGQKYYFDPQFGGGMITGFRKVGNGYYYFDTNTGAAYTNRSYTINGNRWYFNHNGVGTLVR